MTKFTIKERGKEKEKEHEVEMWLEEEGNRIVLMGKNNNSSISFKILGIDKKGIYLYCGVSIEGINADNVGRISITRT